MQTCNKSNCNNVPYTNCDKCGKPYCKVHIKEVVIKGVKKTVCTDCINKYAKEIEY